MGPLNCPKKLRAADGEYRGLLPPPCCLPGWLDPIAYARVRERGGRAVVEWRRGSCKGDNKAQTRLAASFIFILGSLILNINISIYETELSFQSYFRFNPGRHLLLNVNEKSMSCKMEDYYFHQNSNRKGQQLQSEEIYQLRFEATCLSRLGMHLIFEKWKTC